MHKKHDERFWDVMMRGPYLLQWKVATGGYEWSDEPPGGSVYGREKGPWLVPLSTETRDYYPLRELDIHRAFARVKTSREGILTFAGEHGELQDLRRPGRYLGEGSKTRRYKYKSGSMDISPREWGNLFPELSEYGTLGFWQKEISRMRRLIKVWDAIRSKDRDSLEEIIIWTDSLSTVCAVDKVTQASKKKTAKVFILGSTEEGATPSQKAYIESWKPGDLIEPATFFVSEEVNSRLQRGFSAEVIPSQGQIPGEVFVLPSDLLTALYLSFAIEMSGYRGSAVKCQRPGCNEYFIPKDRRQIYHDRTCANLVSYHKNKEKWRKKAL